MQRRTRDSNAQVALGPYAPPMIHRIEGELAYARFRGAGRSEQLPEGFANRLERGRDALAALDRGLSDGRPFVAADPYTVADIALDADVRCAGDATAEPRCSLREEDAGARHLRG
jgi:glutathione S-transferase